MGWSQFWILLALGLAMATGGAPASAQQGDKDPPKAAPSLDVHLGMNLRTDLGPHPIRLDTGVRWKMIDFALVLDPMVFTDGMMSTDLLGMWRTSLGVGPLVGWRLTTIGILDGPQLQENVLIGLVADLPRFFDGWVRAQAGLELAATIARHGGGLPTEFIGFSSGRSYIDLLNFALFIRGEIAIPLAGG